LDNRRDPNLGDDPARAVALYGDEVALREEVRERRVDLDAPRARIGFADAD
jgi:hypothetical protein